MPAFFLVFRIGRFTIPLPWFAVWLMLLPVVPAAIIASPFFHNKSYGNILQNAHLAWWIIVGLHGLTVNIDSKNGDRIFLSFV
ncbi:MAG: hypothetical protein B1H09_08335 [Gemmatimonadaceae bacterium 4484_173]|nr:MAG: hypothetical protein B1H09_08335 [Gemmatimonadaceae bacterium 4484_173]RKZ04720.1 MAG: hypothetical protein DRQ21_01745 [Candidatus Fermentibacteria bacterium]